MECVLAFCAAAALDKARTLVQSPSVAYRGPEGGTEVGHRDELVLLVPAESRGKLAKKGGCHVPHCSLQGRRVWVICFDRLQLVHQVNMAVNPWAYWAWA